MPKVEIKRFQLKGVRQIQKWGGRAIISDQMGLGKTISSLWYAHEEESTPIVVVCPAFLKWNWEKETRVLFGMRPYTLEGRKTRNRQFLMRQKLIIVNYDIIGAWLPYLEAMKPQILIIDESHYIKSRSAKRTKHVLQLARIVPHVLCLSGTPLESRPAELWTQLHAVRPDKFKSFFPFATEFCKPRRRPWGWEYKGASKLKKLRRILFDPEDGCVIRRTKAEVLKDLPPKQREVIVLNMDTPGEYQQAENDFKKWLVKTVGKGKAERGLKSEAVVKMGYLKRLAAKLKMSGIEEWIDNFLESDEKIILFAIHKSIIARLTERYRKKIVVIDGTTPRDRRREHVEQFLNNEKTPLLLGQLKAAGVGWNAPGVSNVLHTEWGWTPAEHDQADDRIHGIGRGTAGKVSTSYYFVAKGTIEERICEVIQEKQQILDAVLDGKKTTDFNLFDRLIRSYQS